MKRLLLLRHAKSAWDDPGLDDFERPLASRGVAAAPLVGRWLKAQDLAPDLVLCSPAVRAVETWELIAPLFGSGGQVKFEQGLYEAGAGAGGLLCRLHRLKEDPATLLLLGHNPALQELARTLCGTGEEKPMARLAKKFPTAAVAVIRFDVDAWADVAPGAGYLEAFETPKRLRKAA